MYLFNQALLLLTKNIDKSQQGQNENVDVRAIARRTILLHIQSMKFKRNREPDLCLYAICIMEELA